MSAAGTMRGRASCSPSARSAGQRAQLGPARRHVSQIARLDAKSPRPPVPIRDPRPLVCARVRIWVDMTAPAHPLVLRPLIERFRAAGHEVHVTARDYAQTLAILDRLAIPYVAIGAHGGASRRGKLWALGDRTRRMLAFGRRRGFDLALGHGSNDLALAAAGLRIP